LGRGPNLKVTKAATVAIIAPIQAGKFGNIPSQRKFIPIHNNTDQNSQFPIDIRGNIYYLPSHLFKYFNQKAPMSDTLIL
jgi:hypothetical protein